MTAHKVDYSTMLEKARKLAQSGNGFTVKKLATPPGRNYSKLQSRAFISWAEKQGHIIKTGDVVETGKQGRPAAVYTVKGA